MMRPSPCSSHRSRQRHTIFFAMARNTPFIAGSTAIRQPSIQTYHLLTDRAESQ
jgi:hypothetical protein